MDARIEAVLNSLMRDIRCTARPAEQAAKAGLSLSRFYELFRTATGTSPARYIRHRRFERAEEMLRTTDLSVKEIANHTGRFDFSHFVRDFKRLYGKSPRTYRRAARNGRVASEVRAPDPSLTGKAANKIGSSANNQST
jgi:transcriptional regulator GlxA family with amidase domain